MSNTVEIIIKAASEKAAADIKQFVKQTDARWAEMSKSAKQKAGSIEDAFEKLRIRSVAQIEKEKREIQRAYNQIAKSGKSSAADITRAHEAATTRQKALAQEAATAQQNAAGRVKKAWSAVNGVWLKAAATAYAAKKAWDLAFDAAQFMERQQAFHNMAASMGADGKKLLADLKRLSRGTVSEMELMEKAGTAMGFDIPAEKIAKFMEIARSSAKLTGQTVTKSFEDISLGVARQSKMILDNLMIFIDVEKANEAYAAKMQIVGRELTDVERKQAFLNATLEAGAEITKRVGMEAGTASEAMQRWKARVADASIVVGKALMAVGIYIESHITAVGAAINYAIGNISKLVYYIVNLGSYLPGLGAYFDAAAESIENFSDQSKQAAKLGFDHVKENIKDIGAIYKDIVANANAAGIAQKKAAEMAAAATKKANEEIKKTEEGLKALLEQSNKDVDIRRQAIEEMYRETGIGAEAAAQLESQKLIEKASKWQQAGVEIEQINEYLYQSLGRMEQEAFARGDAAAAQYYDNLQFKADELVTEFQNTQNKIAEQLNAIDKNLVKKRSIAINDKASAKLRLVKNLLDSIQSKTVYVEVIHTGTGSTKKPLTEKIAEIQGMYAEMPTEVKFNADMTAVTEKIRHVGTVFKNVTERVRAARIDITSTNNLIGAMYRNMYSNPIASGMFTRSSVGSGLFVRGSYKTGTDYVPKTGLYLLHEGEEVNTREEAAHKHAGSLIVQKMEVNMNVSRSDVKNPETLGERLADAFDRAIAKKIKYGRSSIPGALMGVPV